MKIIFILSALFFLNGWLLSSYVSAAILIEDKGKVINQPDRVTQDLNLRQNRKMGVGLAAAGALGGGGVNLEINFTPEFSFLGGFGLGTGYQSYHFQAKNIIGGQTFLPYFSVGFARWHSTGSIRKKTIPSFFSKKFLTPKEKNSGKYSEYMIYSGLGLQFVQLYGEWQGFSLYAEALVLVDIDDMLSELTGGLGMTYYF